VKVCFNTANFVGRLAGYRFAMSDWMTLHQRTAAETDGKAFADICREIADAGYEAVELWQALAEPAVLTQEAAKERRAILDDHALKAVGYGGYLGTGAEKVCPWLGIDVINGGFSLDPEKATTTCREHGVKTNFENHPQKSVEEMLTPIGGGNEWLGLSGSRLARNDERRRTGGHQEAGPPRSMGSREGCEGARTPRHVHARRGSSGHFRLHRRAA
jgi:hypothetical protein